MVEAIFKIYISQAGGCEVIYLLSVSQQDVPSVVDHYKNVG
jgi:hypothetical protein